MDGDPKLNSSEEMITHQVVKTACKTVLFLPKSVVILVTVVMDGDPKLNSLEEMITHLVVETACKMVLFLYKLNNISAKRESHKFKVVLL